MSGYIPLFYVNVITYPCHNSNSGLFQLFRWNRPLMAYHDDVIIWEHFPRNWPFVRGIHLSPVDFPHKGQWRGASMFTLIYILLLLHPNKRLSKPSRRRWFETPLRPLWRQCIANGQVTHHCIHSAQCGAFRLSNARWLTPGDWQLHSYLIKPIMHITCSTWCSDHTRQGRYRFQTSVECDTAILLTRMT